MRKWRGLLLALMLVLTASFAMAEATPAPNDFQIEGVECDVQHGGQQL